MMAKLHKYITINSNFGVTLNFTFCLSVLQEAISTRNPELVRLVLRYRDYQRTTKRLAGIPRLLERLRQVSPSCVFINPEPVNDKTTSHALNKQLLYNHLLPAHLSPSFQ